jgi:hypothetical protein
MMKLIEWLKLVLIYQSSKNFDKKVTVWQSFGTVNTQGEKPTRAFRAIPGILSHSRSIPIHSGPFRFSSIPNPFRAIHSHSNARE